MLHLVGVFIDPSHMESDHARMVAKALCAFLLRDDPRGSVWLIELQFDSLVTDIFASKQTLDQIFFVSHPPRRHPEPRECARDLDSS